MATGPNVTESQEVRGNMIYVIALQVMSCYHDVALVGFFAHEESRSVPSTTSPAPIQIFLSNAREDFEVVAQLYNRLAALGLKPWMDKRDILPVQRWRELIPQEVQRSDFVFICLSPRSVDKRGFFQREIRTALDAWLDKLREDIYLIPVS